MGGFSKELRARFLNKGPEEGFCAICRTYGRLTVDHVPPKGCGNVRDAIIRSVFPDNENDEKKGRPYVISQGGSHFRTICDDCNRKLFGSRYDKALADVVKAIDAYIIAVSKSESRILPPARFFDYQPNKFIRSVLGHLLAANAVGDVSRDDRTAMVPPLDAELRRYVLDPTRVLPSHIDLYYWFYPFRRRIFMKHGAMTFMGQGGNIIYGHVFKFFPFGFWIVDSTSMNDAFRIELPKLNGYMSDDIEAISKLAVQFAPMQKQTFPESPPDNGMWLLVDELVTQAIDRH